MLLERWPESTTVTFSKDFAASRAFWYPSLTCRAIEMWITFCASVSFSAKKCS